MHMKSELVTISDKKSKRVISLMRIRHLRVTQSIERISREFSIDLIETSKVLCAAYDGKRLMYFRDYCVINSWCISNNYDEKLYLENRIDLEFTYLKSDAVLPSNGRPLLGGGRSN